MQNIRNPNLMVSDNAKTFQKSKEILQDLFEDKGVYKYLRTSKIKWANILSRHRGMDRYMND